MIVCRGNRASAAEALKHLNPHCESSMPGSASVFTIQLKTLPVVWRYAGSL